MRIKKRIFEIIQPAENGDIISKAFDFALLLLIFLNVAMVIVSTFTLPARMARVLDTVEAVSAVIFTVEYILRVWTSDLLRPKISPAKARIRYVFSFMAIIDLLAVLPFYIPMIIPVDLRVLRMFRVIRLLRIIKVNRYTTALARVGAVLRRKASQLISSLFVVAVLMIIASILMYNAEHDAQPEVFKNAFSGLWWAIATLTTVGYGDIYPITIIGKVLSAVIALLGIGLVAVPTGIISAGFFEDVDEGADDEPPKYCPHCGKKL